MVSQLGGSLRRSGLVRPNLRDGPREHPPCIPGAWKGHLDSALFLLGPRIRLGGFEKSAVE